MSDSARIGTAYLDVKADFSTVTRQANEFFNRFGKTGKIAAGLGVVGAAGIVLGKQLYDIGEQFDKSYDKIRTGTGKTGKQLRGLKKDFKAVVQTVPTDFESAGDAITDLNRRLGVTGKPLRKLSREFLQLSKITETDVTGNIKAGARAFEDWAVPVKKQSAALNQFYRASQLSGATVEELATLVVKFGSPLRQLGFNLNEATAMFAEFEKAGVNIQTMVPGLKIALGTFLEEGRDPHNALIQTFKGIETGALSTSQVLKIFQKRAGADMIEAVEQGRFHLARFQKEIASGDSISKAEKQTRDFTENWELFKNRVMVKLAPLSRRVFNALGDAMERIGNILTDPKLTKEEKFTKIFQMVSDAGTKALSTIASHAGQLAPKAAVAFARGFLEADIWGKLAIGGFLISKFGGFGAISKSGEKTGRTFGKGVMVGAAVGLFLALPDIEKALDKVLDRLKEKAEDKAGILGDAFHLASGALDVATQPENPLGMMVQASKGATDLSRFAQDALKVPPPKTEKAEAKLRDWVKSVGRDSNHARVLFHKGIAPMQGDAGKTGADINRAFLPKLTDLTDKGGKKSDEFAGRVGGSFAGLSTSVREAFENINQNIQSALKGLNVGKVPSFQLKALKGKLTPVTAGVENEFFKQRGGPINLGAPSGDTVPAMLERGEYVLNRKAVAAIGKQHLDAVNFSAAPRFQKGGGLGSEPRLGGTDPLRSVGQEAIKRVYDGAKAYLRKHRPAPTGGVGGYKGPPANMKQLGDNSYVDSHTLAVTALIDKMFGLTMTDGYRDAATAEQYPSGLGTLHHDGSPSNPGATDSAGPMGQMQAALAFAKAHIAGLQEAQIDNVAGWNLHLGFFKRGGSVEPLMKGLPKGLHLHGPPLFNHEGPDMYGAALKEFGSWAKPGPWKTHLDDVQEKSFKEWLSHHPNLMGRYHPDTAKTDYDLRGFWLNERDHIVRDQGQTYLSDVYKTPYSVGFSKWSKYAKPGTPFDWVEEQKGEGVLADLRSGQIVLDHRHPPNSRLEYAMGGLVQLLQSGGAPSWVHGSSTLSADQLATLAHFVGAGSPGLMSQIAQAESGGNPRDMGSAGDKGLWQIIPSTASAFGIDYGKLFDPLANAQGMKKILDGQGLGAWSTYKSGAYASYPKGDVSSLAGVAGGGGGLTKGQQTKAEAEARKKERESRLKKLQSLVGGAKTTPAKQSALWRLLGFWGRVGIFDKGERQHILGAVQNAEAQMNPDARIGILNQLATFARGHGEVTGRDPDNFHDLTDAIERAQERGKKERERTVDKRKKQRDRQKTRIAGRGTFPKLLDLLLGQEHSYNASSEAAERLVALEPENLTDSYVGDERTAWTGVLEGLTGWRNTVTNTRDLAEIKAVEWEDQIRVIKEMTGDAFQKQKWRIPALRQAVAGAAEFVSARHEDLENMQGVSGPIGYVGNLGEKSPYWLSLGGPGKSIFDTQNTIRELGLKADEGGDKPDESQRIATLEKLLGEERQRNLIAGVFGATRQQFESTYPFMGAFASGGVALVGERGPELAHMPSGTRIHSAEDTAQMFEPKVIINGDVVQAPGDTRDPVEVILGDRRFAPAVKQVVRSASVPGRPTPGGTSRRLVRS